MLLKLPKLIRTDGREVFFFIAIIIADEISEAFCLSESIKTRHNCPAHRQPRHEIDSAQSRALKMSSLERMKSSEVLVRSLSQRGMENLKPRKCFSSSNRALALRVLYRRAALGKTLSRCLERKRSIAGREKHCTHRHMRRQLSMLADCPSEVTHPSLISFLFLTLDAAKALPTTPTNRAQNLSAF